jgi:glycosyltransferase involved in cell wall biosynthesis
VAGFISMLGSIAMLIYIIVSVAMGRAVSGWGSMMFSLWFLGGLILISLGIIGEYIGRIYLEAKNRPRYIIEKEL